MPMVVPILPDRHEVPGWQGWRHLCGRRRLRSHVQASDQRPIAILRRAMTTRSRDKAVDTRKRREHNALVKVAVAARELVDAEKPPRNGPRVRDAREGLRAALRMLEEARR